MDGSLEDATDRGSTELVSVPELEAVGLARQHSVPLVKIVPSSTQDPLSDVINNPLSDVIRRSGDVTIHTNDVRLSPETSIVVQERCATTSDTKPTSNFSSLVDTKTSTTFTIEPDWREAAQEQVLTVRCKKTVAELVKSRFGSGSRGKCIHLGKQWFTPTEFEAHCGRFQGQSLLILIEEGYLQVHATSCSCGACLDDDAAAGSVRLHRPYKRKRRDRFFHDNEKTLKQCVSEEHTSATPTVTLPVSGLGELTVVPGIVLGGGTSPSAGTLTTTPQANASSPSPVSLASLPLDKAWEHMNEGCCWNTQEIQVETVVGAELESVESLLLANNIQVMVGLERSVSRARVFLEELRERTQQETLDIRQKHLQEKEEAVTQAKIEAQLSNMTKSSEGFLVQVREDDGSQSLQPIMLDSLLSNVPNLNPAPPINGVRKKCVNCNRESELECAGCHNRAYCSDFCQRRDWANHQSECGRTSPTSEDPLSNVSQTPGYIFMLSD